MDFVESQRALPASNSAYEASTYNTLWFSSTEEDKIEEVVRTASTQSFGPFVEVSSLMSASACDDMFSQMSVFCPLEWRLRLLVFFDGNLTKIVPVSHGDEL